MTIKLQVGKKYRNRKGEVRGPLEKAHHNIFRFVDDVGETYQDNGWVYILFEDKFDLIEEVIEPAQEPVKKPHKHAELIKAWADGAQIQYCDSGTWRNIGYNTPTWDEDTSYRIKPQELPQWRKDLAEKMKAGGVLERFDIHTSIKSALTIEEILDPNINLNECDYRIKPEPKPDITCYYQVFPGKDWFYPRIFLYDFQNTDKNLKLIWDSEGNLKDAEVIK